MAFIPVPATAEVNINQRLDGEQVQNNLYFYNPSLWSSEALQNLANAIGGWVENFLYPPLSQDLSLVEVVATAQGSAIAPQESYAPVELVRGGVGQEALPNSVALCISFRTGLRGRSARGRNYVAGLPEGSVVQNTVSQALAGALVSAYNQLPALAASLGCDWVVVSRYANGAPRAEGVTYIITNAIATDLTVDSQRRRLPGRGA